MSVYKIYLKLDFVLQFQDHLHSWLHVELLSHNLTLAVANGNK